MPFSAWPSSQTLIDECHAVKRKRITPTPPPRENGQFCPLGCRMTTSPSLIDAAAVHRRVNAQREWCNRTIKQYFLFLVTYSSFDALCHLFCHEVFFGRAGFIWIHLQSVEASVIIGVLFDPREQRYPVVIALPFIRLFKMARIPSPGNNTCFCFFAIIWIPRGGSGFDFQLNLSRVLFELTRALGRWAVTLIAVVRIILANCIIDYNEHNERAKKVFSPLPWRSNFFFF